MSLDFAILENALFSGLYIILDMDKRIPIQNQEGKGSKGRMFKQTKPVLIRY